MASSSLSSPPSSLHDPSYVEPPISDEDEASPIRRPLRKRQSLRTLPRARTAESISSGDEDSASHDASYEPGSGLSRGIKRKRGHLTLNNMKPPTDEKLMVTLRVPSYKSQLIDILRRAPRMATSDATPYSKAASPTHTTQQQAFPTPPLYKSPGPLRTPSQSFGRQSPQSPQPNGARPTIAEILGVAHDVWVYRRMIDGMSKALKLAEDKAIREAEDMRISNHFILLSANMYAERALQAETELEKLKAAVAEKDGALRDMAAELQEKDEQLAILNGKKKMSIANLTS